jgi:hypothetical protein
MVVERVAQSVWSHVGIRIAGRAPDRPMLEATQRGRATGRSLSVVHNQPHRREASQAVQEMFQRVLTGWAMDALSLRRRGLDRPTSRECAGLALARPGPADDSRRVYAPVDPAITWRSGKAA